jgi:hypothetical protein
MKHVCSLALATLFLVSGATRAQSCGGMPAVNGVCIPPDSPTSPLHSTYGQNSQSAMPPDGVWADRWGAVAADGPSGILGATTGMASRRKAEKAALAQCRGKGGKSCEVDMAYRNQCISLVTGENLYFVQPAISEDEAARLGIESCRKKDVSCRVYYSACSMAERVR